MALESAWRLEREHKIAVILHQSLLPGEPPAVAGLLAWRYLPTEGNDVGGDWYDVLPLEIGDTTLIFGDVTGHDVHAAALMGQLRLAMEAYAIDGHRPAGPLPVVAGAKPVS